MPAPTRPRRAAALLVLCVALPGPAVANLRPKAEEDPPIPARYQPDYFRSLGQLYLHSASDPFADSTSAPAAGGVKKRSADDWTAYNEGRAKRRREQVRSRFYSMTPKQQVTARQVELFFRRQAQRSEEFGALLQWQLEQLKALDAACKANAPGCNSQSAALQRALDDDALKDDECPLLFAETCGERGRYRQEASQRVARTKSDREQQRKKQAVMRSVDLWGAGSDSSPSLAETKSVPVQQTPAVSPYNAVPPCQQFDPRDPPCPGRDQTVVPLRSAPCRSREDLSCLSSAGQPSLTKYSKLGSTPAPDLSNAQPATVSGNAAQELFLAAVPPAAKEAFHAFTDACFYDNVESGLATDWDHQAPTNGLSLSQHASNGVASLDLSLLQKLFAGGPTFKPASSPVKPTGGHDTKVEAVPISAPACPTGSGSSGGADSAAKVFAEDGWQAIEAFGCGLSAKLGPVNSYILGNDDDVKKRGGTGADEQSFFLYSPAHRDPEVWVNWVIKNSDPRSLSRFSAFLIDLHASGMDYGEDGDELYESVRTQFKKLEGRPVRVVLLTPNLEGRETRFLIWDGVLHAEE